MREVCVVKTNLKAKTEAKSPICRVWQMYVID